MVQILPASKIEKYMKILVYGDPGVGKTTFAATAEEHPAMRRTLVVNIEGGMLSIAGTDVLATEQIKNIADVENILWGIANKDEPYKDLQTIVIDSGTELQTLDIEQIVASALKKKQGGDRTQDDVYIEDYGKSTARLKRIFRHFRDLPCNVVVTALTRRIMPNGASKKQDPIAIMPQFTEKLATSVMGYMDFVWYMYQDDDKRDDNGDLLPEGRCLLTQAHGPYKAKTRGANFSKAIGTIVRNPNLAQLYKTLIETETQQKGKKKQ